jgi:hypothetical protein
VEKFNQAIKDNADKETVLASIESVHSNYQKLAAVFE